MKKEKDKQDANLNNAANNVTVSSQDAGEFKSVTQEPIIVRMPAKVCYTSIL